MWSPFRLQSFNCKLHILHALKITLLIRIFNISEYVSSNSVSLRTCAVLRSQDNGLQDQSLTIKDGNVIGNIGEEYATSSQSWNTSRGYWNVSSVCELTACQDLYLADTCSVFGGHHPSTIPSIHWQSASCKCKKTCKCSNINWQQNVCARAYFHADGCNSCDATYTELENANPTFPEEWSNEIASLVVRPGCRIILYEEEHYEEEFLLKAWRGKIGSYKCFCDNALLVISTPKDFPDQEQFLHQLQVPGTLDEVVDHLRQQNYSHPGLLSAFSSLIHGRSSKNAYILLVGSTGSGKSSAINILLNNHNVTLAGEDESTTSEILEFHVSIPLPQLRVQNSELRIIDTPGLGDTRGLKHDAVFLATLDTYLSEHSELKNQIPNLVLVFHHFTDNRYNGEGAKFVNMIRGLDSFRTRITDENYSNVLFVFTHFCSENSKTLLQNPSIKLMKFKEVIEEYTLFPKPILTSVIENKGTENELLMVNDNYILPNKEYFPSNLINKFDTITMKGNDKMGRTIISAAFANRREYSNIRESRFSLVNSTHSKVAKYLSLLSAAALHFGSTEVSQQLATAFDRMSSQFKTLFPSSLLYLQRYLNVRIIRIKADLPQTTVKILELLEEMEKNDAVLYLLENGLNLTHPTFTRSLMVPYSFNYVKDTVLSLSPYKLDTLKISQMSYRLPDAIKCKRESLTFNSLQTFDTKEQYIENRATSFGVNKSIAENPHIFTGFQNKIKSGFFIKDTSCSNNVCAFVATRFYQLFKFNLNANASLSQSFIQRVNSLSAFNEASYENVELWTNFFNDYGTHVVKSALVGGRIDIYVRSPSSISVKSFKDKLFQTVEFAENVNSLITGEKIDPKRLLPSGVTYSLVFHGGSPSYHTSNLTGLNLEDAIKTMKNWKKSLKFDPVVFPLEFIAIDKVAQIIGTEKANHIREASLRLQTSSLSYVAPTPDPKVLEELARVQRENEERLKQLAAEKKRKEEQAERERLAAIETQHQRELERMRLEEQRIREEQELKRKLEEERQRFLQQQEEERKQAEEAERLRKLEHDKQMARIRQDELLQQRIRESCERLCYWPSVDECPLDCYYIID
ncbi:unnamed protein product [Orchesella dallaii]|uniref:MACPF domain-containing protein n=1 Tax=Orchesella dallaii TaxID=48710 RepID=A0ABP1S9U6_9HEXA